jgi:hypothetical protein
MEQELDICEHTRVRANCPLCEFEAKGPLNTQAFLEGLPYEYPEEFPEFFGNGAGIKAQRKILEDQIDSFQAVANEGFVSAYKLESPSGYDINIALPYERIETVRESNESE